MSSKIKVLFVDDEPRILAGLRRKLASMGQQWEMVFTESGVEALNVLEQSPEPFDVVITDMRMPGMSGVDLLNEIKKRHPQTIRIVLSGQADKDAMLRAIGLSHQYLSKPCETETIKSILAQALGLRNLLAADDLKQLISQIETLPSLPAHYNELIEELNSPDASLKKISQMIAQDISMTAKMLQLANSAYFGLVRPVSDPAQAVILLGLDLVRIIVLSLSVFSQFDQASMGQITPDRLQEHGLAVGMLARRIAEAEQLEPKEVDYACTAGLLHDVGKLVLAANLPERYAAVLARVARTEIGLIEAEREVFGASHAEVGAYLMGLWGLPTPIVEALAFHHHPRQSLGKTFTPLTAVHVANVLIYELNDADEERKIVDIETDYLAELGVSERLSIWRTLCQEMIQEQTSNE